MELLSRGAGSLADRDPRSPGAVGGHTSTNNTPGGATSSLLQTMRDWNEDRTQFWLQSIRVCDRDVEKAKEEGLDGRCLAEIARCSWDVRKQTLVGDMKLKTASFLKICDALNSCDVGEAASDVATPRSCDPTVQSPHPDGTSAGV